MTTASAKAARLQAEGDLSGALLEYEAALAAAPDDPALLAAMAGLAERLEMPQAAVRFWAKAEASGGDRAEAADGQARALGALGRFDEAVAVLQATLPALPEDARLWNRLGVILTQAGQAATALTFFDESVRLNGASSAALYNRGSAKFDLGLLAEAKADFDLAREAARKPSDIAMIDFAAATLLLAGGDLASGWDAYETRHAADLPNPLTYAAPGRRLTPSDSLRGRRVLVLAEQGVGDEIMFANLIPDLIEALGPDGRLSLAIEGRLVALFQRSFPGVAITAHATGVDGPTKVRSAPQADAAAELWTPLASLAGRFRSSVADFPAEPAYLRPNPLRVAHWRAWLGSEAKTVGLTWRSGKRLGDRRRNYPPLETWAPILRTPGLRFVNLQYGDCADELRILESLGSVEIIEPPGINLRADLDDLAALCVALDLVVGVANATTQLAGACGCPSLLLTPPAAWPMLGTDRYPWHPATQVIVCPAAGEWAPAMSRAAERLETLVD
jgi:tetratricopeptide (TPR) repeat protein